MIDMKHTLDRAGVEVLDAAMQIEGVSAALRVLAADMDGRVVTDMGYVRLLELLSGCCDGAVHRLGIAHDMIETVAAERQEGDDE